MGSNPGRVEKILRPLVHLAYTRRFVGWYKGDRGRLVTDSGTSCAWMIHESKAVQTSAQNTFASASMRLESLVALNQYNNNSNNNSNNNYLFLCYLHSSALNHNRCLSLILSLQMQYFTNSYHMRTVSNLVASASVRFMTMFLDCLSDACLL